MSETNIKMFLANASVNAAIVDTILPRLYYLLDRAISPDLTKEEKIEIRRALPAWCDNTFTK